MKRIIAIAGALFIAMHFSFVPGAGRDAFAAPKTFPAGSYIVPMDACWQPNNDIVGMLPQPAGCDPNKNDQSIFQAYGFVYNILKKTIPVYWILNPNKTDSQGIDLTITKAGSSPVVAIEHSALTSSGSLNAVDYKGAPFVIDANDMTSEVLTLISSYPAVKLHKSNYDFSAEVDKVLSGTPPKVAVLGEGSVQVLTDYLKASGLGNQLFFVFDYVTSTQIKNGILSDYQLIWAPHWEIDNEVPVAADRPLVISAIRSFLESGKAGFFECASIESLERAFDVSKNSLAPASYYAGQGFLLDKNYNDARGRIETNGGTQDFAKMVFEKPTDVLTSCGGWKYQATGGHVHNLRASQQPDPDYVYNSTVSRYVHDIDSQAITGYAPKGYDYYLGGRINGSPTQGYVSYLAGHTYIECTDNTTPTPADRLFQLEFNAAIDPGTVITVEAIHSGCTAGSCPTATYNLLSAAGTYANDSSLYVDLDSASYEQGAVDPTKSYLKNIFIGNRSNSSKTLTGIVVTFSGNPTTTHLLTVTDTTDPVSPATVCSPNSPTPAACPSIVSKTFNFPFSANLNSGTLITVEAVYAGCTAGSCPKGTLTIGGANTSHSDGVISVDMSGAAYDSGSRTLTGVKIANLSGTARTLTLFRVSFPGNGTTQLTTVQDVTGTPAPVCTSNQAYIAGPPIVPATCPAQTLTPTSKAYHFRFTQDFTSGTITVEAVHGGCTQGSTCSKATYTFNAAGDVKRSSHSGVAGTRSDGMVKVDMSGATFNHGSSGTTRFSLKNVQLSSLTGGTVTVTHFWVDKSGSSEAIRNIYLDPTTSIYSSSGTGEPALYDINPDQSLTVSATGGSLNVSLAAFPSALSISLGSVTSSCTINWSKANTCGIKYVLNTLFALQFQIIPNEYVKAQPIVKDDVLYKATFEYPGYKGHLYAIDVKDNVTIWDAGNKGTMPAAGSGNPANPSKTNPSRYIFTNEPGGTTKINFDPAHVDTLKPYIDPTATTNGAIALINSVRGRYGTSEATPAGTREVTKRLWGIEASTPAVLRRSSVIRNASDVVINRDKVVFAGADDGMLHAFYAGTWDPTCNDGKGCYPDAAAGRGTGKEIWAYIPSTLLSSLKNQTFTDCNPGDIIQGCDPSVDPNGCVCPVFAAAVAVNGAPSIGDFFVDHDNNPSTQNVWKTILVSTASILSPGAILQSANQGIVFALDVTTPETPGVLWEKTYKDAVNPVVDPKIARNYYGGFPSSYTSGEATLFDKNMGTSKGAAVGRVQVGTSLKTQVFLTSKWINPVNIGTVAAPHNVYGITVYSLDFRTGDILWATKILYTGDAEGVNETPAVPALMDIDENGTQDYVVVGDMQGRLWVLRTTDGISLTGSTPAYVVSDSSGNPRGKDEPIGASASVFRNYIVFGTGARDSLANQTTTPYRVYALLVTPTGIQSAWKDSNGNDAPIVLGNNEKVWGAPIIDPTGRVYIATAIGYSELGQPDQVKSGSSGRFIVANLRPASGVGTIDQSMSVAGAAVGGVDIENKHAYVVAYGGQVIQIGGDDFTSSSSEGNPIKILWWKKL